MKRIGLFLLVTALGTNNAVAGSTHQFDIWLQPGLLQGDTTYTIGGAFEDNQGHKGQYWDPLSELKWPLDIVMVALGGQARVGKFSVRGDIAKNITGDAGDLEDSDWGVYYDAFGPNPAPGYHFYPTTKDVFSTSTTDISALIFDVRGRYAVVQGARFSTNVGLGFRYQRFSMVASDVHQYSPSFYDYRLDTVFASDPFFYVGNGPGIDYEVTYSIPFAELSGLYRFGTKVSLEGSVGYSPFVQAKDRDDHLLRFKLSEGSGSGTAWLLGLTLRLQATRHWFTAVGLSGLFIDTSGSQKQSFYGGEYVGYEATIDQTITSSQTYGSLEVGYLF